MRLVRFQLEQALADVSSVLDFVDKKNDECGGSDEFENWHFELLDLKLRLEDMVRNVGRLEE